MTGSGELEHEAFVYDSDEEYTAALVPLVLEGIADGDVVIAVVPARMAALLRAGLGASAEHVTFIDAVDWYRQPSRTIAAYDGMLAGLQGRRARVIGEVQFGDTELERLEWTRYEAALNRALARYAARVVCPYDVRRLPSDVVEDARRTHPHVLELDRRAASDRYVDPDQLTRELRIEVTLPDEDPHLDHVVVELSAARRAFTASALAAGLRPDRVAELTVAVNEVMTNALLHGGGTSRLRVWHTGAATILCAVDDAGPGADDPLLGFVPVAAGDVSGRGVWLARQLFDRAELGRVDSGFRVTLATA